MCGNLDRLFDLFAENISVTCVSGKFFDHRKYGPPHTDGSFTGIVLSVIEIESGSDLPRSLASALEFGDYVLQQLIVGDGEGAFGPQSGSALTGGLVERHAKSYTVLMVVYRIWYGRQ